MEPIEGMLLGFGITFLLFALVAATFALWMFIHGIIRTIKMWPEGSIFDIEALIIMLIIPVMGAIAYYFVIYRTSRVLEHS